MCHLLMDDSYPRVSVVFVEISSLPRVNDDWARSSLMCSVCLTISVVMSFVTGTSHMMTLALTIILPLSLIPRLSGSLFKQCALMIPSYSHQTCVTYEDLNLAFDDATSKFGIAHVGEKFTVTNVMSGLKFFNLNSSVQVGQLGRVITETSRNLAKQYSLSKDAVSKVAQL